MTSEFLLIVTCFAQEGGPGLVVYRADTARPDYERIGEVSEGVTSPLHATSDATHTFLYVSDNVEECDGTRGGAVAAYGINARTGTLDYLNRKPSRGEVPCYVSVSADGRFVLAANYRDGCVAVLPVQADGSLGDAVSTFKPKEEASKAHCVVLDASNRHAFSSDLGLDRIYLHRFDPQSGALERDDPPFIETAPKSGPRHLASHPNGKHLYCMTEYDSTLLALDCDGAKTSLAQVEAALPTGFDETSYGADVLVHPNGRFLYVTNRGHDSIAIFSLDEGTGRAQFAGHVNTGGSFPWSISLDPAHRLLLVANQKSDRVNFFAVEDDGAELTAVERTLLMEKPVAFTWVPRPE